MAVWMLMDRRRGSMWIWTLKLSLWIIALIPVEWTSRAFRSSGKSACNNAAFMRSAPLMGAQGGVKTLWRASHHHRSMVERRGLLLASPDCRLSNDLGFTDSAPLRKKVEVVKKYPFQAEVKKVLDIIVNSLYTDRDIFLRELVSNAADACDKKRILLEKSLTSDVGEEPLTYKGRIRVFANKEANVLVVEDDGIGMDRQEMIDNLGTIARSGTLKFASEGGGVGLEGGQVKDLIGQFGVGFYSAFLVADRVVVESVRFNTEEGRSDVYRWSSSCDDGYDIEKLDGDEAAHVWKQTSLAPQVDEPKQHGGGESTDKEDKKEASSVGETMSPPVSGTRVILHLKPECDDYLQDYRLQELLKKYSEFLTIPIHLLTNRIEYERVPEDVPDEKILENTVSGGGQSPVKYKTVTKQYNEWNQLNIQPPIWTRPDKDIKEKEYIDFYKSTFRAYDDPLAFLHMSVEGQVSFRALLYVPGSLPWELARNMFDEDSRGIRLYVKRVFINDKFQEAVPRWLTFIRGVIDSDELPLNVGREILQKSKMLRIIHKRIASRAIDMMKTLKKNGGPKWARFWDNYGKYLKIGAVEDRDHQEAIASLIEFYSTNSNSDLTTLDEYIDRMNKRNSDLEKSSVDSGFQIQKQEAIYYLAADSRRAAEASPALEMLRENKCEVLFGVEPLDEFFLASLAINNYKEYPIIDVNKSDLKLNIGGGGTGKTKDSSDVDVNRMLEPTDLDTKKIELGGLVEWMIKTLGPRIHNVILSSRLLSHPAMLVQGEMGLSPTMQRYMRQQAAAQGVSEQELFGATLNQPILEINPMHQIIDYLDSLVRRDPTSIKAQDLTILLFDIASLQGGYTLEQPGSFAKSVLTMMDSEANNFLKSTK